MISGLLWRLRFNARQKELRNALSLDDIFDVDATGRMIRRAVWGAWTKHKRSQMIMTERKMKLYDVTAFYDTVETDVLAKCTGVDVFVAESVRSCYRQLHPGSKIEVTPSEGIKPVEPEPLKIYSLLMAWDVNDILEQGCFGTVLWARGTEHAIELARAEMVAHRWDDADEAIDDDGSDYHDLDITEGANIWAAPQMLSALLTIQDDMQGDNMISPNVVEQMDDAIKAAMPGINHEHA